MKIHIIGIGGVAMAGIANWYLQKGHSVSGSDTSKSEITDVMQKQGVNVLLTQASSNVNETVDLLIYTEAVPANNIELKQAVALGIKCLSGAEALAKIAEQYFLIAVSGMHGKTTTASMIAFVLEKAGLDPSYIIGAKNGWGVGGSKYMVIEADDYKAKFLNYKPNILVLTNIDKEHMDYFKNFQHIIKVFKRYVSQVKSKIIANKDDAHLLALLKQNNKTIFYSAKEERGEVEKLKKVLQIPGQHNIVNALAVLKACRELGIKDNVILKALGSFKGAWRRFEERKVNGVKIIHDYAHHPTEIKASLQGLREKYEKEKINLFFQPHQYQRTYYLKKEFVKVFREAAKVIDKIFITDIYDVQGRENKAIKAKISSAKLVKAINKPNVQYIPKANIMPEVAPRAINVLMGAGDIYNCLDTDVYGCLNARGATSGI